jgi:hypothetical protein
VNERKVKDGGEGQSERQKGKNDGKERVKQSRVRQRR